MSTILHQLDGDFLFQLSLAKVFTNFLFPVGLAGLATAMIDLATLAELGHIADMQHSSAHAKTYAISEFSTWLGVAVGNSMIHSLSAPLDTIMR